MGLSAIFTLSRVLVAFLLFFAIGYHSRIYFFILKLAVSGVAIWGMKTILDVVKEKRFGFLLLFYFTLLLFFSPFNFVTFDRNQWIIIDIFCGLFLLASVFIHEPDSIFRFFGNANQEKTSIKLSFLFGVGFILFGFYLTYVALAIPLNQNYLKNNGKQIEGRVIKISQLWGSATDSADNTEIFVDSYRIYYKFTINGGKTFNGKTDNGDNPIKSLSDEEFMEKYGGEYYPKENEIYPIKIYYQSDNPPNNSAFIDVEKTFVRAILDALHFPKVFGILFIFFVGFRTCRNNLRLRSTS